MNIFAHIKQGVHALATQTVDTFENLHSPVIFCSVLQIHPVQLSKQNFGSGGVYII